MHFLRIHPPPTPQTSQHVCIALPAQPLSLCTKPPFTVSGACQKQLGMPDCIICVQTVPLLIGVRKIKSLTTTLNGMNCMPSRQTVTPYCVVCVCVCVCEYIRTKNFSLHIVWCHTLLLFMQAHVAVLTSYSCITTGCPSHS